MTLDEAARHLGEKVIYRPEAEQASSAARTPGSCSSSTDRTAAHRRPIPMTWSFTMPDQPEDRDYLHDILVVLESIDANLFALLNATEAGSRDA